MNPVLAKSQALRASLRDPAGARYHLGAVTYAVVGYSLGLAGLFAGALWINALATLLLAHAMTIAAYLRCTGRGEQNS